MNASIQTSRTSSGAIIPFKWLVNGNSVYVLQDSSFVLRPVQVILSQDDDVLITGLKQGETILAQEANATDAVIPADKMQ